MSTLNTVVVTGADRNLGLEICREYLKKGWKVYAGKFIQELSYLEEMQKEYPDLMKIVTMDVSSLESIQDAAKEISADTSYVDAIVHNAAVFGGGSGTFGEGYDFTRFSNPYFINSLGALRLVQSFLPLMQEGMKRLCFISSESGVVSVSHRTEPSGYGMSKTAMNMGLRLMFNQLQPMGYTFRLFHPGWVRSPKIERDGQVMEPLRHGKFEPNESAASAVEQFIESRDWEDRMVLIDNEGAAWPF